MAPSGNWKDVVLDSTGQYLVAIQAPGNIYLSTSGGKNWILTSAGYQKSWSSVSCSSYASIIVATVNGGAIHHSDNSPSQSPTQAPTDSSYFLVASPFEAWTPVYIKRKVEAFYGTYVIYFSGLFLLLFIIDKATIKGKTIKSLSAKLAEAAEASKVYKDEKMDLSSDFIDALKDLAINEVESQLSNKKHSITEKFERKFNKRHISNHSNELDAAIITTAGSNMILGTESYICKHISRLRSKKQLASKKQAIIQDLKEGVLRIDDTNEDNVLRIGAEEELRVSSTLSEAISKFDELKPWYHLSSSSLLLLSS